MGGGGLPAGEGSPLCRAPACAAAMQQRVSTTTAYRRIANLVRATTWKMLQGGDAPSLRRFHLAEQPLQAGEMLLIVAAEIVDQAADCYQPVALEHRAALELRGVERCNAVERPPPRRAERRERFGRISAPV